MTIIITGTSTGIGFALAEYFGKKGHQVYGLSRKNTESDFFKTIPTDITNHSQVENAISEILKKEKRIDLLINNAGMGMVGAVEDSKKEEILKLFNLNLVGAVQMMTGVLPKMREQNQEKSSTFRVLDQKWACLSVDFILLQNLLWIKLQKRFATKFPHGILKFVPFI